MSCDFFFKEWLDTLRHLKGVVEMDIAYQTSKTIDKRFCEAVERLAGVLGEYCWIYSKIIECVRQNLQVQKTEDMRDIVKAVLGRILELEQELKKLKSSENHFLSKGLINHKYTPFDVEVQYLPLNEPLRTENVENLIKEAFKYAEDKRIEIALEAERSLLEGEALTQEAWWENEGDEEVTEDESVVYARQDKDDEETKKRKALVARIKAQEKTRQVMVEMARNKREKEVWIKELAGTRNPQARPEIKERAAKLIQKVAREYFRIIRQRIKDCRRDEILGFSQCRQIVYKNPHQLEPGKNRAHQRKEYESEWKQACVEMKESFIKKQGVEIAEDYRDFIRHWFLTWFKKVKFIYEIPSMRKGGLAAILRDEVPTPGEWAQDREAQAKKGKKDPRKAAEERKMAKQQAAMAKKAEIQQKKVEEALRKKYMKNPKLHPGYQYPKSAMTEPVFQALENYNNKWKEYDDIGNDDAKKKFIKAIDLDKICAEVKQEAIVEVDEVMRKEQKQLKTALKLDYEELGEEMPECVVEKEKKGKKIKKTQELKITDALIRRMNDLAFKEILKDYPRTKFLDFIGDHNFCGDDLRCGLKLVQAYAGETRFNWWQKALKISKSRQFILLVGPEGSGKTTLVHAAATANDATLFELVPDKLLLSEPEVLPKVEVNPKGEGEAKCEPETAQDEAEVKFKAEVSLTSRLEQLAAAVLASARASQPAIIYIRNVHHLFSKKPPGGEKMQTIWNVLLKNLVKKINKNDKISVIGSCVDPWLTKTAKLLKRFPTVLLLPNTNYSCTVQLLNDWVARNRSIPRSFNVNSLAYLLQGYRYGFLKQVLDDFLTAERIVKMAAYGLKSQDVFDFILEQKDETKVEYDKYLKWYLEKTAAGRKEVSHNKQMLDFKAKSDAYEEKLKKEKNKKQ